MFNNIFEKYRAASKKAEEDKMDPVKDSEAKKKFDDRKDKDIDNDGDVDSSDKFLHKRRKAIAKSKKEDEPKGGEDTAVMNPKKEDKVSKEEADPDTVRMMKANPKMQKTGGPGGMKGLNKKAQKDTKAALKKEDVSVRDRLMTIWEKAADHTKGATKPEEMDSKDSPSGKKMRKDHEGETVDIEKQSHDDAAKAGRTGPKAKARGSGDNVTSGDRNIINKIAAAYKGMKNGD